MTRAPGPVPRAIDVGHILRFVLRRWPLYLLALAVSTAGGYVVTRGQVSDVYTARALLYCPWTVTEDVYDGVYMLFYNRGAVNSREVVDEAVVRLGGRTWQSAGLTWRESVGVWELTATANRPDRAVAAANALTDAFLLVILGGSDAVQVYEYAETARRTTEGIVRQRDNRLRISLLGLGGSVAATVLYMMVFGRARSVAEAALYEQENVFAVIGKMGSKRKRKDKR